MHISEKPESEDRSSDYMTTSKKSSFSCETDDEKEGLEKINEMNEEYVGSS